MYSSKEGENTLKKVLHGMALQVISESELISDDHLHKGDVVIQAQFSDRDEETKYTAHSWLLFARWPLLMEYALINQARPIPKCPSSLIDTEEMILSTLTSNKEIEKYYTSFNNQIQTQSEYRKNIKELKGRIAKANEKINNQSISLSNYSKRLQHLNEFLQNEYDFSSLKKDSPLFQVNLGQLDFDKATFDNVLYFLYTATFVSSEHGFSARSFSSMLHGTHSDKQSFHEMLSLMTTLGMPPLDVLWFELEENELQLIMTNSLHETLNTCFFFQNQDPTLGTEKLRKAICDLCIKQIIPQEEIVDVNEFSEISEKSEEGILCDKTFMMTRCPFIDILVNSNFQESEQIRQAEKNKEIPSIFIEFSNFSGLYDVIKFLYTAKIEDINKSNVFELLTQAQRLGIDELQDLCEERVKNIEFYDFELVECIALTFSIDSASLRKCFEKKLLGQLKQMVSSGFITVRDCEITLRSCGYSQDWIDQQTKLFY